MARGIPAFAALLTLSSAVATPVQADERQIMPGDRLQIVCDQAPWLTVTRTVGDDGRILLPEIGSLAVATQTAKSVAGRIEALLGGQATVQVDCVSGRDGTIRVSGAVNRTLELRFRAGTELGSLLRLADPVEAADLDHLAVSRGDGKMLTVASTDHLRLQAGDRVFVPVLSGATDVNVLGGVMQPSAVRYHKGMTLAAVLEAAGGLAPRGDRTKIVLIRRGEPIPLSLPEDSTFPISPGETVRVAVRAERRYVVVQGAVAHPGLIEFTPGMTLSQAVDAAGGPLPGDNGYVTLRSGIGKRQRSSKLSLAFIRAIRIPDPVLLPDDVLEVGPRTGGKE